MTRVFAGVFGRHEDTLPGTGARLRLTCTGPAPETGSRTVALSGRLRNSHALAAELEAPTDDPERIVALAVERWGIGALRRLRGTFALLVWDGEKESGLLAADQLGAGGLYVHESSGTLSFATEVRELLRILPRRPSPDAASLAQWVGDGQLAPGSTLYEGVRRLEGGHVLRLERGRWSLERYWAPRFVAPAPVGRAEAAQELRAALSRSLEGCIAGAGTVAVQVSGGLDSSLVAALARELAPPRLTAYSLVYPEHPEIDESEWIARVTAALGLPCERLQIRGGGVLAAAVEYQRAWELPATTCMLAFSTQTLRRAASDGVAVVLDGEGGDELLGCSEYVVADRVRRLDLRGALALARRLPGAGPDPDARFLWALVRTFGLRGAVPHVLHRAWRRLPGSRRYAPHWLRPGAAKTYVGLRDDWAWKRLDGPRWWSFLADRLTAGRQRLGAFDLLRHESALAGVSGAHPLLEDLDLVELVLRLPPELSLDPVLTRPLARDATSDVLPDDIRLRPDKVDFTSLLVGALTGPDRPLVEALLGLPDAEMLAYVRPGSLAALLDTPPARRSARWARVVSRLALTECWLRSQSDPRFAQRLLDEHGVALTAGDRDPRADDGAATA